VILRIPKKIRKFTFLTHKVLVLILWKRTIHSRPNHYYQW